MSASRVDAPLPQCSQAVQAHSRIHIRPDLPVEGVQHEGIQLSHVQALISGLVRSSQILEYLPQALVLEPFHQALRPRLRVRLRPLLCHTLCMLGPHLGEVLFLLQPVQT